MENMTISNDEEEPETRVHPVIRRHPGTGMPTLWINPIYTSRFDGMTEAESAPLLNYLNNLAVSPSISYHVTWSPGTLTMWDIVAPSIVQLRITTGKEESFGEPQSPLRCRSQ